MGRKIYLPKDTVLKKWIERGYSAACIAKRYNVGQTTVRNALKKAGISLQKKKNFPTTKAFTDFINGLLLGDGCIAWNKENDLKPKKARYVHSDKNGTYLLWLKKILETFGLTLHPIRQTNACKEWAESFSLESFSLPELLIFREKWYSNGKKEIPEDIVFTNITLFNLYIGNGSYCVRKKYNSKVIRISKHDLCWNQIISDALHKLNINNSVYPKGIYIHKNYNEAFFQYVCEIPYFIPKAYYYKFPPECIQYNRVWALVEKNKSLMDS
jgi:hypothetical protein